MRFTRRTFLQLLGGTAGAAVVAKGQISSKVGHAAEDLKRWATPEEVMVPSICQQCPGGCGLLVRTLDGQVSGIAGNPYHPINRGCGLSQGIWRPATPLRCESPQGAHGAGR